MELTALTELDAVNEIISIIGESPINTLEDLKNVDAINALRILRSVSRQEQARGWSFNTIAEHTLTPDAFSGHIRWQDNYLFLKGSGGEKLIHNGDYVKDLSTNTITFKNPITCEAVLLVPFEELPDAMRTYIITKTAFKFQSRYFGDDGLAQVTSQEIQEAWMHLQEYEMDNNDYNILNNTDVTNLKQRG
jgi:hypothetical protein